eukprot:scaffold50855_cov242-Isochrysis_galbana.AAC.1
MHLCTGRIWRRIRQICRIHQIRRRPPTPFAGLCTIAQPQAIGRSSNASQRISRTSMRVLRQRAAPLSASTLASHTAKPTVQSPSNPSNA